MMNKHTPGTWTVDAGGNIWASDTKVAQLSDHPPQSPHYRTQSAEERQANRLLIAAAPDMLALLRNVAQPFNGLTDRQMNSKTVREMFPTQADIVMQARAIIKRIEGE